MAHNLMDDPQVYDRIEDPMMEDSVYADESDQNTDPSSAVLALILGALSGGAMVGLAWLVTSALI
ncbi:MAG: hypothetical protein ACX94B_03725 [Henriciella sp.]|nr:hypothetical protein [Hyphomonadaceae bacterium]